ncbi:MAG TPA: hypothetical protein VGV88_11260 [Candidatus Dormibacteraeota bacterium]|nr:hypothetical protein [Candidatus Dormibacteraeota bacterium]
MKLVRVPAQGRPRGPGGVRVPALGRQDGLMAAEPVELIVFSDYV